MFNFQGSFLPPRYVFLIRHAESRWNVRWTLRSFSVAGNPEESSHPSSVRSQKRAFWISVSSGTSPSWRLPELLIVLLALLLAVQLASKKEKRAPLVRSDFWGLKKS